jgi:hypothetical protein
VKSRGRIREIAPDEVLLEVGAAGTIGRAVIVDDD